MKSIVGIWLICFFIPTAIQAQHHKINTDSIPFYFAQVKHATAENAKLWDKNIYGPILLIDPDTRVVYTNEPDTQNTLIAKNGFYTGILPKEINFSHTSINWGGKTWAMIVLPLSENKQERIDLITHELFHSAQPSLGFNIPWSDNNHLNEKDGRILLRLEMEALKAALKSVRLKKAEEHLQNALIFRKYRYIVCNGSQIAENRLELLEGLATYTGQMMSGRDKWQLREYLIKRIEDFKNTPTFVRSFAYETVPVYGFFLYQKDNNWNKKITQETDLTEYFAEAFDLDMRIILPGFVKQVAEEYHVKKIMDEETVRNEKNRLMVEQYRKIFFENPHVEIKLENMNMSFNPTNLIPLDVDEGTVYPTLRISDNWGILTVTEGGALLSSGWRWVIVTEPVEIKENEVIGKGWHLELNKDYYLEKTKQGNYLMSKK